MSKCLTDDGFLEIIFFNLSVIVFGEGGLKKPIKKQSFVIK